MKTDKDIISIIQRNHEDNSADGEVDGRPARPSSLLDLASSSGSRDGSALQPPPAPLLTLRKRSTVDDSQAGGAKEGCKAKKFAMSSFNSGFLQGIFQDIAKVDADLAPSKIVPENAEGASIEPKKAEVVATADIGTVAAVSECNLAKRRRMSTMSGLMAFRSLGRCCGKSQSNLAIYSQTDAKKTGFSHFFLPAVAMPQYPALTTATNYQVELPATVSTSYSFQSQGQKETASSSSKTSMSMPHGNGSTDAAQQKIPQQQEGDFGWYIDTDCDDDGQSLDTPIMAHATTTAATDLAFSACVAPRQAPTKKQKAEVEWAAAADMVDDVLGDFF